MVWSVFNYLLTQKLARKAKVALGCSQYKKLLKTLKVAQKLPSTIYLCLGTTLMARRFGPSGLRSKMASSSSTSTSTTSSAVPSKTSMRAITFWPGFRTQKRLILVSFVNHLAFRGAHMRICDAKDCKTGRWTIWMFIKVRIDRVKGQMNQNFDLFYFSSILVKCA